MIRFENPVFKPGINLTVRRGVRQYEPGTELGTYISGPDDVSIGFADPMYVKHIRFCDIKDLSYVHDPALRDYDALLGAMKEYYINFDPSEIVTMLFFLANLFDDPETFNREQRTMFFADDDGDETVFL